MSSSEVLSADAILPERPFTNIQGTLRDLAAMEFTLSLLRITLARPDIIRDRRQQQILWGEAEGRHHRLIVNDAPQLLSRTQFVLVGFYGRRREDFDETRVFALDDELVAELTQHPGLCTYCTCSFADGCYGNTILFADPAAKEHWATSKPHVQAVELISPSYYYYVRLHNGILPGPLLSECPGVLQVTKYYDFGQSPPWRGQRALGDLTLKRSAHRLVNWLDATG